MTSEATPGAAETSGGEPVLYVLVPFVPLVELSNALNGWERGEQTLEELRVALDAAAWAMMDAIHQTHVGFSGEPVVEAFMAAGRETAQAIEANEVATRGRCGAGDGYGDDRAVAASVSQ